MLSQVYNRHKVRFQTARREAATTTSQARFEVAIAGPEGWNQPSSDRCAGTRHGFGRGPGGPYRGFAIRIFTTGAGGGSLALSISAALVMALRLFTAAADISGNLGITETHALPAPNIRRLSAEDGSHFPPLPIFSESIVR